jgi:hypothetical protein
MRRAPARSDIMPIAAEIVTIQPRLEFVAADLYGQAR